MLNPLTHRRILKKGMPGQAQIVEMGTLNRNSTTFNVPMTLQVFVEGITPYEVEDQWWVKAKDAVGLHGTIPIKINPDDRQEVAIDWEGVRANYEREVSERREALASGGLASGFNVTVGEPIVIDLGGGGGGFAAEAEDSENTLSQLERLAALHRSGALTDAEFEAQKRRILDDA